MIEVKEGRIDIDKARNITKLAGQVTESFYAEVKIAKTRVEAGEVLTALGDMKIGSEQLAAAATEHHGPERRLA